MPDLTPGKYYLEVECLGERDGVATPPFGMALVRIFPGGDMLLVNPSRLHPVPGPSRLHPVYGEEFVDRVERTEARRDAPEKRSAPMNQSEVIHIILTAAKLIAPEDEVTTEAKAEYNRGVAELVCDLIGVSMDERENVIASLYLFSALGIEKLDPV